MTSTPFNIGLSDDGRRSSKVLRPPGGGHTDIFGGDAEPVRGRRRAAACGNAGTRDEQSSSVGNGSEQNGQANGAASEPVAAAAVANEPSVVQPVTVAAPPQPTAQPPKRVRVPPGGFSSGLW